MDAALAYSNFYSIVSTCINCIIIFECLVSVIHVLPTLFDCFTLYSCYLGINTGNVTQRESGGECDGFRASATIPPSCLAMVIKPVGLGYQHYAFAYLLNAMQMAAPRAAIGTHLAMGHRCLCRCRTCAPLPNFL